MKYVISEKRYHTDSTKIKKVKDFLILKSIKKIKSAIRLFIYYKKFVFEFSKIIKSIN